MAHSNPNLIPEVITDRNGKVTTVHRRRQPAAPARRLLPVAKGDSKEPITPLHSLRSELLDASPAKEQDEAFNWLFRANPELTELSARLLTTGTTTGQRLARAILTDGVTDAQFIIEIGVHRSLSGKAPAAPATNGALTGRIVQAWSYGNVREEAGLAPEAVTEDDFAQLRYFHSVVTIGESPFDDIPEEEHRTMSPATERYWRGLSALSMCIDPDDSPDEMWEHAGAFISWAAGHEDIATVIRVAAKHSNIDPRVLPRLIEAEANGVGNALTDGWI